MKERCVFKKDRKVTEMREFVSVRQQNSSHFQSLNGKREEKDKKMFEKFQMT